jgi:hypothetical protein
MNTMNILDVRNSVICAIGIAVMSLTVAAMPLDQFKAASGCRALVVDPASAANLQRPHALRYRGAPMRVCVPA